jgi:thioredoxin-dependent peroxiredoxin
VTDSTSSTRLTVGQQAPDFSAALLDGTNLSLSQLRGKPVWLAFFRYAACPLCNLRVHQLTSVWPTIFAKRDFVMLAVFQSQPVKLERLVERHTPPFKIVCDPQLELYTTYQLERSMKGIMGKDVRKGMVEAYKAGIPVIQMWDPPADRVPADFLIDRDGMIRSAFYGENIAQHIPFEDVSTFLENT